MITYWQLLKHKRKLKIKTNRVKALSGCPQKTAFCLRVYKAAPKKPNSARRSVVRITILGGTKLSSIRTNAYVPGEGHQLSKFNKVLIRGGRLQDVPGVNYKVIRGKFDCLGVLRRAS